MQIFFLFLVIFSFKFVDSGSNETYLELQKSIDNISRNEINVARIPVTRIATNSLLVKWTCIPSNAIAAKKEKKVIKNICVKKKLTISQIELILLKNPE